MIIRKLIYFKITLMIIKYYWYSIIFYNLIYNYNRNIFRPVMCSSATKHNIATKYKYSELKD